jgi:SSS family transporter
MSGLDHTVFAAYLCAILIWGLVHARCRQSAAGFHVADRSMRWFPVGASIMATVFCATNFTAFSDEVAGHGLYVILSLPVFVLIAWPVTRFVMPFYHRLAPVTAYAFLEATFDTRVKRLASALFILWRVVWMAVAIYATALLLARITGIDFYVLVLLTGVLSTLHTALGGMRSVMWSDVAQFTVIIGALVVGVAVAAQSAGGICRIAAKAAADGLAKPFYPFDAGIFAFDPTLRISAWSALIGTLVAFMARYGADQMVVQRYFAARSLRDARIGFWINVIASLIALLCLAFLGFAVHAWSANAGTAHAGAKPMAQLGRFIAALPSGTAGILAAGLFASTMSSVDSGVHSCTTALVTDFATRRPDRGLTADRVLIGAIGTLCTILACFVGQLGTVFEIANKIINGLGSPLLAVVLLGMLGGRWVSARGVFAGGIAGTLWSIGVSLWWNPLALHYYAVVNLFGTLLLCYVFSLASVRKPTPL